VIFYKVPTWKHRKPGVYVWLNTISIKMGKFQVPNFTKWLK
jgi:hypothetical protein